MVLKKVRLAQKICPLTLSKTLPLNSWSLDICLASLSSALLFSQMERSSTVREQAFDISLALR